MKIRNLVGGWDNTKKLAVITFFSNFYFYNHVGTLYQQTRGLSLLQVSSIWAVVTGAIFLFEVPTGIVADRIGRKKSVVIAILLQASGEWLYLFANNYLAFVLIALLAGLGYAFLSGANEALVYDSLPTDDKDNRMKRAMGIVGGAYQLAFCVAPLVGGLVVAQLEISFFLRAILLTAVSVTLAFFVSLTLQEPKTVYEHTERNPLLMLRDGLKQIWGNKKLKWILAVAVLTTTFSNSLLSLYQPRFAQLHIPNFWIGAVLSMGGLVAFLIQKNIQSIEQWLGRYTFLVLSLLPGLTYLIIASVTLPTILIPIFIVAYASMEARNPLLSAYQNAEMESKHRATTLSLMNMLVMLYVAGMSLVFGRIADYSIPLAFATIGGLIIFFTLVLRVDKISLYKSIATANK